MQWTVHKIACLTSCLLVAGAAYAAGPVIINDAWVASNGSIVSGTFTGTSSTPAISVTTTKPITIQNATVSGPNNLISLSSGSNVTVQNTVGTGTNPNVKGQFKGSFITASKVASLLVQNCTAEGVYFGVYAIGFSGNPSNSRTISILKNVFVNIDGRASDGNGGYIMQGNVSHAHAIQLNGVHGIANIEIAWNQSIVTPFQGYISDTINIYSSSGTPSSHLRVHDNYNQGSMGSSPGNGEHYSGGGIITDGSSSDTASTATAYVDIYSNQVVMTANYGVAIAAGHDNNIYNNRVVSAGFLANGTMYAMTFANAANNANLQKQTSAAYFNNNVHDNVLGLIRAGSNSQPTRSDWYLPGQSGTGNNQHFLPNVSTRPAIADERAEFTRWQAKLAANGISIGAQTNTGTLAVSPSSTSDARCSKASDTLYIDNNTVGTAFTVSNGTSLSLSAGSHSVALASPGGSIPANDGTSAWCTSVLSANQATIVSGQTNTLAATYTYHLPVTTGTLSVTASASSAAECLSASDTLYLDGTTTGTSFTVKNGTSQTLSTGIHTLALASGSAGIAAGGGQSGTCSSVLSNTSVTIAAGQSSAVTTTYQYNPVTAMNCLVIASIVNSTQLWDVKVDGFHEEVSLTGFPVNASGMISVNGTFVMKNKFKLNFWDTQGLTDSINGNTGTFSGTVHANTGSLVFSLDGYLTDATPLVMNTGDHPLQSMMVNGVQCTLAFPLIQSGWGKR